jgi:hypothetical protein
MLLMGSGREGPLLLWGSIQACFYGAALHHAPAADLPARMLAVLPPFPACMPPAQASPRPLAVDWQRVGRQAADLGVGIMGKEGRQAVNNSDFAISQFRRAARSAHARAGRLDPRAALPAGSTPTCCRALRLPFQACHVTRCNTACCAPALFEQCRTWCAEEWCPCTAGRLLEAIRRQLLQPLRRRAAAPVSVGPRCVSGPGALARCVSGRPGAARARAGCPLAPPRPERRAGPGPAGSWRACSWCTARWRTTGWAA